MGFLKDVKIGAVVVEATKAAKDRKSIFVARLSDAPSPNGLSGELDTIGSMISQIEALGWFLANMTAVVEEKGSRPTVIALFRPVIEWEH